MLTIRMPLLLLAILIAGRSCLPKSPSKPSFWELEPSIEREISVGMNVQDAKREMETLGFQCEVMKDATLRYYADTDDITMTPIENVDFLVCRIRQQDGFITESLTVSLLLDEDSVKQVFYVRDLTGL